MSKGKKKLPLILGLVIGLPVLIGLGFFGAIKAGVVKSPLFTNQPVDPNKKTAQKAPEKKEEKPKVETPAPEPVEEPKPEAKPKFVDDPEVGAEQIADIWASLPPQKIAEMSSSYKDPELARILGKMNSKKAAAVIAALQTDRAAKVSREIEKQASQVPIEEDAF